MKIGIASDHRGYDIKKEIINYLNENYIVVDYGTDSIESTDYPIYALKVGNAIKDKQIDLGILICGTGIGMSIVCNKVKGVRCAKVSSIDEAILSRQHNNANVIAISAEIQNVFEVITKFIETSFSNEPKHKNRVDMIDNYDN